MFDKDKEGKKDVLARWLNERVRFNDVPRMTEIVKYVKHNMVEKMTKKEIREVLQAHPYFKMNLRQQRDAGRARKYRPVLVSSLGHWHADIGYFAVNKRYETPETYRHGFLVAKDVLSRYVYATPLLKSKSADSMIRAFERLFEQHATIHPNVNIKSIAFDKETSVMSHKVQKFLAEKNIRFHSFEMSSSKAKFAEGAIRLIREKMAVMLRRNDPNDRWWYLLNVVCQMLNSQQIYVDGKKIGDYAPKDVKKHTVKDFINLLHKKVPAYYYGQFDIAPDLVVFKYHVGTLVRAKLIVTSSEVVGNKRSETNLTREVFMIEERVPYVTRNMKIGIAYKCRNIYNTDKVEVFQEDEIVPTSRHGDDKEEEMNVAYLETPTPGETIKRRLRERKPRQLYRDHDRRRNNLVSLTHRGR